MKKKNLIKKNDFNRILVTETLPYETPIIFSNDGLYDRVTALDSKSEVHALLVKALVMDEGDPTVPYLYKVKKNSAEFRRLSLLHPSSQWKLRTFYEKYGQLIIHYCSESPASIRSPQRIAGSFYSKSSWENVNKYKSGGVTLSKVDQYAKHAPSYFAYRGYDRLYKFFNSRQYFSLEKRYPVLRTLDVSKCFDSIYTHCLSWAVKDKAFTKEFKLISTTFGQEFDETIRHGNHNETNGIPIGPESSRIFAEILFQKIDLLTISKLSHEFGGRYTFRRYVDDVFIFADSEEIADTVYTTYADTLTSYNLHANVAKSITTVRPFVTSKSRLIYESSNAANEFFERFLEVSSIGTVRPLPILSPWKLTKNYIESIKSLCAESGTNYDEVASFLIAVFTERVKRLVNITTATESDDEDPLTGYTPAFEVILDVLFFLYSVAPSVGASYKVSTSLILTLRFFNKHIPTELPTISQKIYELSSTFLLDQCDRPHGAGVEGFVHLESLNILLAIRELSDTYLLPESIISNLFIAGKRLSYFTIVSCLFYVKDDVRYSKIRNVLLEKIRLKLRDLSDIKINSEKAYLFLDMLSCPYVSDQDKRLWITKLYKALSLPVLRPIEITSFIDTTNSASWQIDWKSVDLLNSLEKKELRQAY